MEEVANGVIDNSMWGYWVECKLNDPYSWGPGSAPGIHGASMVYTITEAAG
jgi:hypothetical protein